MPTDTFFNLPAEKRDRFLELAIEEFAAHDYDKASISRLVAQAGIAKGSFYQYFADKRELYFYLLELAAAEKRAFLVRNGDIQSTDFFTMLEGMFRAGLDFQFSNPKLAQVAYRALYGDAPFAEESLAHMRAGTAAFLRGLIEAAQAAGTIDPHLEPALVAYLLENLLNSFGDYLIRYVHISPADLAAHGGRAMDRPDYWRSVEELLNILRRGLQPAASASEAPLS
jgi:AcrR family transcriptional regulator